MQNASDILLLVCTPTWTSNHVSANQELFQNLVCAKSENYGNDQDNSSLWGRQQLQICSHEENRHVEVTATASARGTQEKLNFTFLVCM